MGMLRRFGLWVEATDFDEETGELRSSGRRETIVPGVAVVSSVRLGELEQRAEEQSRRNGELRGMLDYFRSVVKTLDRETWPVRSKGMGINEDPDLTLLRARLDVALSMLNVDSTVVG